MSHPLYYFCKCDFAIILPFVDWIQSTLGKIPNGSWGWKFLSKKFYRNFLPWAGLKQLHHPPDFLGLWVWVAVCFVEGSGLSTCVMKLAGSTASGPALGEFKSLIFHNFGQPTITISCAACFHLGFRCQYHRSHPHPQPAPWPRGCLILRYFEVRPNPHRPHNNIFAQTYFMGYGGRRIRVNV